MMNHFTRIILITSICLLWGQLVFAQETGSIKGIVVDDDTGEEIAGANILISGTKLGASSAEDGSFIINDIPSGDYTIIANFVGYLDNSQQITVVSGEELQVNFSMVPSVLETEAIVVVGYGVEEKKNLLGATSVVNVDELNKIGTTNTLSALEGKVAGVNIEPYSGQPDSDPNIKIRGTGTLNNNDPLYIIDGVPGNISFVDPSEIQTMTVLKDASAAAIYGSRAANGVIIIETKRGFKKQPMRIDFSSSYGIQDLTKKWEVLNARQFFETLTPVLQAEKDREPTYEIGQPFLDYMADPEGFLASHPDVDWQDEYYGSSVPVRKYNLNITGGSESSNYGIAGNYFKQDGIATDTWAERWSIRVNSDYDLGNFVFGKLNVGESMSFGRGRSEVVNGDAGGRQPHFQVLGMAPTVSPYATDSNDEDGFGGPVAGYSDQAINIIGNNILRDDVISNENIKATGYVEYDFKGIKYKVRASVDVNNYNYFYYAPTYTMGFRSLNPTADRQETINKNIYTVFENFISYNTMIDKHEIKTLAGFAREKNQFQGVFASKDQSTANGLTGFDAFSNTFATTGSERVSKLQSLFARLFYSYDNTYLANFTIRRDGSSRFDTDKRFGNFPSYSLGWRISNESFFKKLPFANTINDLKFRVDQGTLGNQEIDDYAYIASILNGGPYGNNGYNIDYPFGDNVFAGSAIVSFPAIGVHWEETKTTDYGFDLTMLNNTVLFSMDYYTKLTDGILYATPIPLSTGSDDPPYTNLASVDNKGWEFSAGYRDWDGDFRYSADVNLTTYKNEVKKLGTKSEEVWSGAMEFGDYLTTKTVVGGEIGAFYLYETDGLFQSESEITAHTSSNGTIIQPNAEPGDIKFIDQNDDGILDEKDKINMGSAIPDFEYGLGFNASYKNFDFSCSFHGVSGKKMFNGTKWYMERMKNTTNWSKNTLNAWTPTNTNTDVPRATIQDPNSNDRESDRFLENASYLRLRNIQIGYTIPKHILSPYGFGKIRIYVNADNLFTITDYSGYDPSVTGNDLFARGVDRGIYPTSRTISSGIELSFN